MLLPARLAAAGLLACAATALAGPFDKKPEVTAAQINEALGIEMFTETPLWEEDESAVAKRLEWPEESRTTELASYRRYALKPRKRAPGDQAEDDNSPVPPTKRFFDFTPIVVGGRNAFSAALYATGGKPEMVSLVFANKGDADDWDKLRADMEGDEKTLEAALTGLLGEPKRDSFGKRELRERVSRWDWNGTAILLSTQDNNYVGLRLVPVAVADNAGVGKVVEDREMQQILEKRIERRDNGDVVVTEIPMVDQGPKGYCVPATWERYLRYLKIPADMYVLAMAGNTEMGGGTSLNALNESVDNLAQLYKRRVEVLRHDVSLREVKRYIDKGLPLMWVCFVDSRWDDTIDERAKNRKKVDDMKDWKKELEYYRDKSAQAKGGFGTGHMRMIIGYNEKTDELAISDSWGEQTAERWVTEEEAKAMSGGQMSIIKY